MTGLWWGGPAGQHTTWIDRLNGGDVANGWRFIPAMWNGMDAELCLLHLSFIASADSDAHVSTHHTWDNLNYHNRKYQKLRFRAGAPIEIRQPGNGDVRWLWRGQYGLISLSALLHVGEIIRQCGLMYRNCIIVSLAMMMNAPEWIVHFSLECRVGMPTPQ